MYLSIDLRISFYLSIRSMMCSFIHGFLFLFRCCPITSSAVLFSSYFLYALHWIFKSFHLFSNLSFVLFFFISIFFSLCTSIFFFTFSFPFLLSFILIFQTNILWSVPQSGFVIGLHLIRQLFISIIDQYVIYL